MDTSMIRRIDEEIERLRRRHAVFLRELPDLREVPARWTAEESTLIWFVPLEEVLEPDIDVEISPEVLVVRARRVSAPPATLLGVLPVPAGFDPEHPDICFFRGTLEIRIRRVAREAGR